MSEHSELPWIAGLDIPEAVNNNPNPCIIWSGSMAIGLMESKWIPRQQQIANANLVVEACNNYQSLLASNKELVDPSWIRPLMMSKTEINEACIQAYHILHKALATAQSLLSKERDLTHQTK